MGGKKRGPANASAGFVPMTEQRKAYAAMLDVLRRVALGLLLLSLGLHAAGVLPPRVAMQELSESWSLPAQQFLARIGAQPGWWWLTRLGWSDHLMIGAVAFLAAVPLLCYVRIIPVFVRTRNLPYLLIAVLQAAVLLLAASGLLRVGR